jgi:hypothetical protein
MSFSRPAFAYCQRRFGRGPVRAVAQSLPASADWIDDLRLFAATFAAGFLFVSILIG